MTDSCITITFGDQAENHKGMQIIGKKADKGFSIDDLLDAKRNFESIGLVCELIDLKTLLDLESRDKAEEAMILVVNNYVDKITKNNKEKIFEELKNLDWDSKAFMYGRVVNKKARHNLCFDDEAQEPDYKEGKGRIVSWKQVPELKKIKDKLNLYLKNSEELAGEGNFYYDVSKTGISYHCDLERLKVVGIRFGSKMPLHFQWFLNSNPVGQNIKINLEGGDLYVMSEVAKGTSWNKKNVYTLRHAAGCDKYTKI
jgi:hypothetical protein